MNIIESKREKSDNTIMEINDCSRDMLNFGINNLKIYHKLNTTKNVLLNDEIKNNKLQARGNAQTLDVFEDDE